MVVKSPTPRSGVKIHTPVSGFVNTMNRNEKTTGTKRQLVIIEPLPCCLFCPHYRINHSFIHSFNPNPNPNPNVGSLTYVNVGKKTIKRLRKRPYNVGNNQRRESSFQRIHFLRSGKFQLFQITCLHIFRDLCKITILMSDLGEFEAMNKVYEEILRGHLGEEPLPARTTFEAGKVPRGAR